MLTTLLLAATLQTAPATPAADPNKKVCRREVATGSIMGRQVCRTRAEWKQFEAETAAAASQALDQRSNRMAPARE